MSVPRQDTGDGPAVQLTFEQAEAWLMGIKRARIDRPTASWIDLELEDSDLGSSIFCGNGRVEVWLKREPFLGAKLVGHCLVVETDDGPMTISPR